MKLIDFQIDLAKVLCRIGTQKHRTRGRLKETEEDEVSTPA